jgi:hypothetical protein
LTAFLFAGDDTSVENLKIKNDNEKEINTELRNLINNENNDENLSEYQD